ncbi:MAG: precorrin-3B C(17)-methyltransferase [Oscillospiraceae bacterium]|nr:precorrin-3B C(17)-methyltransferase [Oscillospiraceae bacterium]
MGKLYVAGYGPGAVGMMTADFRACADACDIIVGYSGYIDALRPLYPGKQFFDTPMKQETDRCLAALKLAAEGETVCVVCSGDSGVYGMAGLVYELSPDFPGVEITVIPGITAACSGAAVLGAPIGHDFAVISLSDLLTDWALIEKRLCAAAMGDFCVCLYNPSSHKRADYLQKACDILLEEKSPETVCGIVRNIGRDGEAAHILTLAQLRDTRVDMFTTVFIGNTNTKIIDGKMVTPRGYRGV